MPAQVVRRYFNEAPISSMWRLPAGVATPRVLPKVRPSSHGPAVEHVAEPARSDALAYGAYLAGPVAHCVGCHTPLREGGQQLDRKRTYAGGRELPEYGKPGGAVLSRNITPHPNDGI